VDAISCCCRKPPILTPCLLSVLHSLPPSIDLLVLFVSQLSPALPLCN
jgi:hypothetical protein